MPEGSTFTVSTAALIAALVAALVSAAIVAPTKAQAQEDEQTDMRITPYRPMYFIAGNPWAKIEVSFKTQVVRQWPLYFGYSQLMMWDIFRESPRFADVNYNPDAFFRLHLDPGHGRWIDLGIWEHESNGRGGAEERSWDRMFVRYRARTSIGSGSAGVHWEAKAWVPVRRNENNGDVEQYRGVWELAVTLSDFLGSDWERGDLTLRIYPGGPSTVDPLRGGQELTFRSRLPPTAVLPVVVAQVFHGFAENLSDYRDERWGVRAGFGF